MQNYKSNKMLPYALLFAVSVALALMQFQAVLFPSLSKTSNSLHKTRNSPSKDNDEATLRPGDLPGYTGWARPSQTLAGWFELDARAPPTTAITGHYWTIRLTCRRRRHSQCAHAHSLFDVRAYGPSVLSGKVYNRGNGIYDVSVYFLDPGLYQVEVVLAYSHVPSLDRFPLDQDEPLYEGHLLPEFPIQVQVNSRKAQQRKPGRLCQTSDLVESSSTSAIE